MSTLQQLSHVDLVEGDIDPLLADPANFVLDAVECEDVNEWVPDLGMTEYPVRSIYRPPALATSGMPTTLRHRFWDTLRGMRDHTGERYLGLVIYAAAGERCPFELRLGAEEIGRLEPTRHDNRRHLIVADRCISFSGRMEVLQATAPGPGTYRIESLVLLARLPRPSSFVPALDRLTAAVARGAARHRGRLHYAPSRGRDGDRPGARVGSRAADGSGPWRAQAASSADR